MQETWVQSLVWEDPLEKDMAAHSSILAWKIHGKKEPGRLQSMGLQRVRHNFHLFLLKGKMGPAFLSPSQSFRKWIRVKCPLLKVVKNPPTSAGDTSLIPGSERSPGGGHGNPLQYSCLENPMVRGAWQATVHGVTKSWTWLSHQVHSHAL